MQGVRNTSGDSELKAARSSSLIQQLPPIDKNSSDFQNKNTYIKVSNLPLNQISAVLASSQKKTSTYSGIEPHHVADSAASLGRDSLPSPKQQKLNHSATAWLPHNKTIHATPQVDQPMNVTNMLKYLHSAQTNNAHGNSHQILQNCAGKMLAAPIIQS